MSEEIKDLIKFPLKYYGPTYISDADNNVVMEISKFGRHQRDIIVAEDKSRSFAIGRWVVETLNAKGRKVSNEYKILHSFELFKDEEGDYIIRHAEWHGISAFGKTIEDAFREFGIAFQLHLELLELMEEGK